MKFAIDWRSRSRIILKANEGKYGNKGDKPVVTHDGKNHTLISLSFVIFVSTKKTDSSQSQGQETFLTKTKRSTQNDFTRFVTQQYTNQKSKK